jgi:hypothetical protein
MQHDAYSLRAAADLPAFRGWTAADPEVEQARSELARWDAVYRRDSREAAIYEVWRAAGTQAGRRSSGGQEASVEARLQSAVKSLASSGSRSEWRWGRLHTQSFRHPVLRAFDLPGVEKSGGAGTLEADGATYREILDVGDWDRSLAINVPGQSGQPASPYYSNLLRMWADNDYFPLVYSRKAVDANTAHRLVLEPALSRATGGAAVNRASQADRIRPPASIDCPRDHLTAYTGRVVGWTRGNERSTIRIRTDWDTDESATLRHAGTDDPSRSFLLRGATFKPEDWTLIEASKGRLRDGVRATVWVCDDKRPPVIDWAPPPRQQ